MDPRGTDLSDPCSLLGTWRLSRVIEDRRLAEVSRVTGRLDLVQEAPDRIRWVEDALWHRESSDVPVRRRLVLTRIDRDWWVRFEDGRDFHPWTPEQPVVHACAPDSYRGLVSGTTEKWRIVWDVRGREKDYRMTTDLEPLSRDA